jgi:hypothetical protein
LVLKREQWAPQAWPRRAQQLQPIGRRTGKWRRRKKKGLQPEWLLGLFRLHLLQFLRSCIFCPPPFAAQSLHGAYSPVPPAPDSTGFDMAQQICSCLNSSAAIITIAHISSARHPPHRPPHRRRRRGRAPRRSARHLAAANTCVQCASCAAATARVLKKQREQGFWLVNVLNRLLQLQLFLQQHMRCNRGCSGGSSARRSVRPDEAAGRTSGQKVR